jgi:hypothetical protein
MGELCPHGWRAQITLFGAVADEDRPVAPGGGPAQVALDWAELQDSGGPPAVMRRVWASTIGEALDAMVADRRTDQTLEQIEQGAVADGTLWAGATSTAASRPAARGRCARWGPDRTSSSTS